MHIVCVSVVHVCGCNASSVHSTGRLFMTVARFLHAAMYKRVTVLISKIIQQQESKSTDTLKFVLNDSDGCHLKVLQWRENSKKKAQPTQKVDTSPLPPWWCYGKYSIFLQLQTIKAHSISNDRPPDGRYLNYLFWMAFSVSTTEQSKYTLAMWTF